VQCDKIVVNKIRYNARLKIQDVCRSRRLRLPASSPRHRLGGAGPSVAAPSVHGFEKMGNFNRLQVPISIGYCVIYYNFKGVVPLL